MKKKVILAAILCLGIFAATFFYFSSQEIEKSAEVEPVKSEIVVYVSGQVKTPAVVTLEDNGNLRIIDAVNAVGGMRNC